MALSESRKRLPERIRVIKAMKIGLIITPFFLVRVEGFSPQGPADFLHHNNRRIRLFPRSLQCWDRPRREQDLSREQDEDQSYDTRFVEEGEEVVELRNMPIEDDFFDDDPYPPPAAPYNREDDYSDWRVAEYEEEEEDGSVGNFWSNPEGSLDLDLAPRRRRYPRRRPRNDMPPSSRGDERLRRRPSPSSRRRGKTTFRSGTPRPPPPVTKFYDRLFWYGFDADDTDGGPADRTMFGGTKGKFNGLAYLHEEEEGLGLVPKNRQRSGGTLRNDYWEEEDDNVEDMQSEDEYEEDYYRADSRRMSMTPPNDTPRPRPFPPNSSTFPMPSKGEKRRRKRIDFEDGDWVSREVSSWWQPDGDDDDGDYQDDYLPRRRKRKSSSSWSPFGAFDTFLGVDREREERAEEYDRQMGIPRDRQRRSRRDRNPARQRRKGYAYRYEDDDGTPPVADYEVIEDDSAVVEEEVPSTDDEEPPPKQELSWEDRALAVERVPPAGIPAWGPTGDLGMDARTKAIEDAMEDIHEARRQVQDKVKLVEQAREDVTILRVDAELERKRLRRAMLDTRTIQAKLRRVDRKVEDASRALRYAQARLRLAQEELAELEARHWAVLSFYNPDKAEEGVNDAIRELEENEPAARRYRDKTEFADSPSESSDLDPNEQDQSQEESDTQASPNEVDQSKPQQPQDEISSTLSPGYDSSSEEGQSQIENSENENG